MHPSTLLPPSPHGLQARWWHDDATTAVLRVSGLPRACPPRVIHRAVQTLARQGARRVLTGALHEADLAPFQLAGFTLHEQLRLLRHDLTRLDTPPHPTRRARRRRDLARCVAIDHAAFGDFWQFDRADVLDALDATSSRRHRLVDHPDGPRHVPVGYAICGRYGTVGYLQRLAVHPDAQRRGLATALVVDGLHWMRRRRATTALVNTQLHNDQALALYEHLGFVEEHERLSILAFDLEHA